MGASKRRRSDRAGRGPIRSPGRPTAGRREHRQAFWKAIARGVSSWDAALAAGVSQPVGTRWFRENGGMPPTNRRCFRGATCLLQNAKRSRSCTPRRSASERLVGAPSVHRRRSRANYGGMRRRAVADSNIGRRRHSGTPSGNPSAPRSRSWPPTRRCGSTCRSDLPARLTSGRVGRLVRL